MKTTEMMFQKKHHLERRNWNISLKYMGKERAGIAQSVARYGLDGPGIESRWGVRFSATVQTGSKDHPVS
jgi:hypothetical protein